MIALSTTGKLIIWIIEIHHERIFSHVA